MYCNTSPFADVSFGNWPRLGGAGWAAVVDLMPSSSRGTRTPTDREQDAHKKKGRRKKHRTDAEKPAAKPAPVAVAAAASSSSSSSITIIDAGRGSQKPAASALRNSNVDTFRADAAESRALTLGADALRREKEFLALASELDLSDALCANLEAALRVQATDLAQTRAQLIEADAQNGELREVKLRVEQEAYELRMLLDAAAARQAASQAEVERLNKAMAMQGEELRNAAAKIHAHREAESKAFAERRKIWERTVEEWLSAGFNKRIDPLVYNVNKDVYSRLQELLLEEQSQREAQMSYLKHATTAELQTLRAGMGAQIASLEQQHEALMAERFDFGERLTASLTSYLKGELASKAARVETLERELGAAHTAVRELRATHERHRQQQLDQLGNVLAPLSAEMSTLQQNAAAMAAERAKLADDDPRRCAPRIGRRAHV